MKRLLLLSAILLLGPTFVLAGGEAKKEPTKKIVVPFDDFTKLSQVKRVLYQIRCNIFHGAKVPGEVNDDRITKCAIPILRRLVQMAIAGQF